MSTTPNKTRTKPLTLDNFAIVIQKDLARMATKQDLIAMREEMATKADLWPMQRDIKTLDKNVRDIRDDVKNVTDAMVSKADLASTLAEELAKSPYARQIENLQTRVNALESNVKETGPGTRGARPVIVLSRTGNFASGYHWPGDSNL